MSTASHDSGVEIRLGPDPLRDPVAGDRAPSGWRAADSGIWLDGGVLACACPECGAPMSIRLWLMMADCFRCGTSIELTEQQEQEALRLLRAHEEAKRAESREAAAAISPSVLRRPKPPPPPAALPPVAEPRVTAWPRRSASRSAPAGTTAAAAVAGGRAGRVAASRVPRGARAHVRDLHEKGGLAVFFNRLLKDLPAWFVSLVVHLIALLLLSLWYATPADNAPAITLSTSVSPDDIEGQQGRWNMLEKAFEFEDPGSIELKSPLEQPGAPSDDPLALEAVELPLQMPRGVAGLPDSVASALMPAPLAPLGRMLSGRDPELRAHLVREAGGTSETEAAVTRGLVFLSRHQKPDGRWSLHDFAGTPDCDGTCRDAGSVRSDVAGTALSLLPFLGAGQTHRQGEYREQVGKGLNWLVAHQGYDGSLCDGGQMYAHGQAAIALCEAYALTHDERFREPAQKALDFIVRAQHSAGGWRYQPKQPGDTSVVGWELMALKSGQMGYLRVPRQTFEQAGHFLNRVQTDGYGGLYSYQPRGRPTPAMSAEALLCRQYLGWPREHVGLRTGVEYLLENLPDPGRPNIYYWYYATQVMHHFGGKPWETWNAKMSYALVTMQEKRGHAAGSWAPVGQSTEGGFADQAGRIYMTSLAVCILEVYYRHMPLYGEAVLAGFE
jgi:hypothetical protein